MTIVEPTWPEQHTHNRTVLDACIRMLADQAPRHGSSAWHALPADHPERLAATVRAADSWWRYWQPDAIATRRAADANRIDRTVADRIRALSHDLSSAADWTHVATGPTWRVLQARRYPWLHDPAWRCHHRQPHGQCQPCALPVAPRFRKDHAA
jgi:hypothetical protein